MSKPKILFFHGYTQNASLFARKSSGLRKLLEKNGYESVYLDGPLKLEPADLIGGTTDEPQEDALAWWKYSPDGPDTFTLKHSIEAVQKAIKQHGPFVGLVGFSQGATLTAILATIWNTEIDPAAPGLKFAVLYSGFIMEHKATEYIYETKNTLPSLHIIGTLDTVVSEERSQALAQTFENATVLTHPGGHFVPNEKQSLEQVAAFIKQYAPITAEENL